MSEFVHSEAAFEPQSKSRPIAGVVGSIPNPASIAGASIGWDYPLQLLADGFVAPAGRTAVGVFTLLSVLVACAGTLLLGLPQIAICGYDTFNFLDGGWRVLQGQVPHVDFYSALGPIYYFLWAGAFKLAHGRIEGIAPATALLGIVIGVWSFAVARKRFGALCAALCTIFLLCFWLAPFAIGDPFYLTTYGMQYNRLGYVFFLIPFIELFGTTEHAGEHVFDWGGASTGLALGLMLFLKANFFIVALVPLAFAYIFRIKGSRHGIAVLCGFLAVLLPMTWYLHGHLGSFLADLKIAGAARATQKRALLKALILIPSRNFTTILAVVGISLLAYLPGGDNKKSFPTLNWGVVWLLLVVACDFVLASSNRQGAGLPLSAVAIVLLADQLMRQRGSNELQVQRVLAVCLFVVWGFTSLPQILDLANAWAVQYTSYRYPGTRGTHIDAPPMASAGFKDRYDPVWGLTWDNGQVMTSRVNDGIALLRNNTRPNERIACICFVNPFSYALMRNSPRGGSPFLDYSYNFNESSAPTAEQLLGDAELVIYPKEEEDPPTIATLLRICQPLLSTKYRQIAESGQWVLLRRIA